MIQDRESELPVNFQRRLFQASLLLGISALLLLWGYYAFVLSRPRSGAYGFPTYAALIFFTLGLVQLARALFANGGARLHGQGVPLFLMRVAFFALLAGLVIGLVATPLLDGLVMILLVFFPYLPTFYAPVVIPLSALHFIGTRAMMNRVASYVVIGGSFLLLVLSVVAIIGWMLYRTPAWPTVLNEAGFLGFGYLLVASGWWLESREEHSSKVVGQVR